MLKSKNKVFSIFASSAIAIGTCLPASLAFADPDPNTPSVGDQTGKGTTEMAVRALNAGTEYGGTEDPNNPPAITDPTDDNYDPDAPGTNLAFTVPSKINFIMKADGNLIAPSSDAVYIDNESAYGIRVSSLDIDANTGWSIVENASSSSAANAASGAIGPVADKLAWSSYLNQADVSEPSEWNMAATGAAESADQLHLVTEGKLANVNLDLDDFTTFATIHWFLRSGNVAAEVIPEGNELYYWKDDAASTLHLSPVALSANYTKVNTETEYDWDDPFSVYKTGTEVYDSSSDSDVDAGDFEHAVIEGVIHLPTAFSMFKHCPNLEDIQHLDRLDVSGVDSLARMFEGCGDLSSVDVSRWNTSNVKDMSSTFSGCSSLTSLDITNWNVSKVEDFGTMCSECTSLTEFKSSIDESSDILGIANMGFMFENTQIQIPDWAYEPFFMRVDTSDADNKVLYLSSSDHGGTYEPVFRGSSYWQFEPPYGAYVNTVVIEDTIAPINARNMFKSYFTTVTGLSNMDMSNCATTASMFRQSSIRDLSAVNDWDMGNVEDMSSMFAVSWGMATLDLSGWNVSKCRDFSYMFATPPSAAATPTLHLDNWNVGQAVTMEGMFSGATHITSIGDLSGWTVGNVTNTSKMFQDCIVLTSVGDIEGWDVSKVTEATNMFDRTYQLTKPSWAATIGA